MKTAVREKPILFSGEMVRAILAGRKSQTRRIVNPQPPISAEGDAMWRDIKADLWRNSHQFARDCCPYGQPGDRLWVRETWAHTNDYDGQVLLDKRKALYAADDEPTITPNRWRPSIHMPRWASRITLEITDVRVQRLQEISEQDARAEGVDWASPEPWGERWKDDDREDPRQVGYDRPGSSFASDNFRRLWQSINGKGSWESNPWVWVISFRRLEAEVTQ